MEPDERTEYETCTKLAIHYETIRMGLLQFFAIFNAALLGFLTWLFKDGPGLTNGYIIIAIGLFAFMVCYVILNGEIREMCFWTQLVIRARTIEQRVNERLKFDDNHSGCGYMDTYRGGFREVVNAHEWKNNIPDKFKKLGYDKPKNYGAIWSNPLFKYLGTSRRITMAYFFLIVALAWLSFAIYGVLLILHIF